MFFNNRKSGDFIKLIKEAEFSYTLGAYYSAIALVGVASEDLTKFLAISLDKTNLNKKNQDDRLKEFKKLGVINEETYENLDFIRKMANESPFVLIIVLAVISNIFDILANMIVNIFKICVGG